MNYNVLKKNAFTAIAILAATLLATTPHARSADSVKDNVTLMLGKSQIVPVGKNAVDVIVSAPDIVETSPIKDDRLSLTGRALGDTNILIMNDTGDLVREIVVHVQTNTDKISQEIKAAYPKEDVKLSAIGDQLVLSGTVSNADAAAHIQDIAQRFAAANKTVVNNLKVAGNQQVMIHVKVIEVERNVLNELGIETDASNLKKGNFTASGTTTNSMGLTIDPSFGTGSLVYSSTGTGPIQMIMRALERDGLVNTLAQPNLTAVSGENARFLAGGEFPIPSARDNNGNITYDWHSFGVSLSFKPIVLDRDRINLQIATEVSELAADQTLQISGLSVPSFNVRRAETTVEMASGGSLMIAGIIQSKSIERMNKLPGIGNVPVLGDLVRSESFSRNETELVVMITPYLVEPFAQSEATEVTDKTAAPEPLNRALAEAMAVAYGQSVTSYTDGRSFGYIME